MKLLALLLLVPTLASCSLEPDATVTKGVRRNQRAKVISKGERKSDETESTTDTELTRRLQHSKGDKNRPAKHHGRKPTGGGKPGTVNCDTRTIYYDLNQFHSTFHANAVGGTNNNVIMYDAKTHKRFAEYTEVATALGALDCFSDGVYTLDHDKEGKAQTQIFTTSTCSGKQAAIVGGGGKYNMAQGYVRAVAGGDRSQRYFELRVCTSLS
jgi:hypothetical protein